MAQSEDKPGFVEMLKGMAGEHGGEWPASKILTNLDSAVVMSKVVRSRNQPMFRPTDETAATSGFNAGVDQISKSTMGRIEDNENNFRLFPDIELACQIVISSIISPKDMGDSELIYRLRESTFPAELVTRMMSVIKTNMEGNYNLHRELPELLRNTLFRAGSTIKAVIPEAAVDQLINSGRKITMESIDGLGLFKRVDEKIKVVNIGLLGDSRENKNAQKSIFSLEAAMNTSASESYDASWNADMARGVSDEYFNIGVLAEAISNTVEVVDNYQYLKLPDVIKKANEQKIAELTKSRLAVNASVFATENYHHFMGSDTKRMSARQVEGAVYKSSKSGYTPFVKVPEKSGLLRKSVGRPLVLDLPSECAAPVYVPGKPAEHIGYFVLSDMDGNPLSSTSQGNDGQNGLMGAFQNAGSSNTMSSMLTDKARKNLATDGTVPQIERVTEIYADLIERDVIERLMKGGYGRKLEVGRNNEIYRIMLARTLQSQMTRLIYIPACYVTYFAFNYHRNGVGRSYLDDLTNITSMRALVLFSKVMAKVKSCIEVTNVDLAIDPRDPDPIKTIEKAKHLVAQTRQQFFPHGLNRMVDLTNWIQQAGIQMTFSGHPRLPTTKFTFETKNTQHPEPDDSLDEMFRHQTYMHFGLSPETVDSATKTDFATTIEQQSILFSRRIKMLSDTLSVKMSDWTKKVVGNDETIIKQLMDELDEFLGVITESMTDEEKKMATSDPEGFKSYLIESFLELLEVDLPKPESTKATNMKVAIQAHADMIDEGLNYVITEDVLPEGFVGDASKYISALKASWKAVLMRAWMAENNYAPELFRITEVDEEGNGGYNLLESMKTYNVAVMTNIIDFLEKLKPSIIAANNDIARIENQTGNEGGGVSDTGGGSSDNSSDFGGGEGGGFGDGGDDEFANITGGDNAFDNPGAGGDGAAGGGAPDDPESVTGGDNAFNAA